MSYTDAENGKVALMQEILGVKDIQDIDLLYELHQEFMDAQKNAGTGNSEGQSELLWFFKNKKEGVSKFSRALKKFPCSFLKN